MERLALYRVRWISGRAEGSACIRALHEDDATVELMSHPDTYGCPSETPIVVAVTRIERDTAPE